MASSLCLLSPLSAAADFPATLVVHDTQSASLSFPTETGKTYRLQQSASPVGPWNNVSERVASGPIESLPLALPSSLQQRFWRVVTDGPEGALRISTIVALAEQADDSPAAAFRVTATSQDGVTQVAFYRGELLRGFATLGDNNHWTYHESYDPNAPQVVSMSATATDADGATASSGFSSFLLADPARFVLLDPQGLPQSGQFIPVDGEGRLGPFEFRPDGNAPIFSQTGLSLRIQEGATIELVNGRYLLSFQQAEVIRGWHDPNPQSLPLGQYQVPIDDFEPSPLAEALTGDPSQPVPLYLLPQRAILWHDGPIGENGIAEAETSSDFDELSNIPLVPRDDSELAEDPNTGEPIYRTKHHGSYNLPGGLKIKIPRQSPWVFVFHQDGRVTLSGETQVTMPNGATFSGSVSWRDDRICFSLTAKKLYADTLGSLLELLPENPADCVPGSPDDQAMNLAADCLEAYRNAYRNFAAGATQIDDVDFERDLVPLPTPVETGAAALEAWAWRLTAVQSENVSDFLPQEIRNQLFELTGNAADSGVAAYSLPDLLAWQRSLTRFQKALEAAQAAGKTGDVSALQSQLQDAVGQLLLALDRRLRESEPADLVPLLGQTLALLLEIEEIRQKFAVETPPSGDSDGAPDFDALASKVAEIVGGRFFAELGIVEDEFDPVFNETLLTLDRFSTAAALKNTLDLWALLQTLDLEETESNLPLQEALQQLVTHLGDVHDTDIRDALDRNSFSLAFIVMRQRLDLMAQISLLGLEDEFPEFFNTASLLGRWDELAEELLNNPSQEWRRDGLLEALRYVSKILAYVPERAAQYSGDIRSDLQRLLGDFFESGRFNTALGPRDWLEWLEGGTLSDRLGRRHFVTTFHNPLSEAETRSRLTILVDGLITTSGGGEGETELQYAFLDQAAGLLLAEVNALRLEIADTSLDDAERSARRAMRLSYLSALGRLLGGYQTVSERLYAGAAGRFGSLAFFSDLLLPGDIKVHEIGGGACFNTATGAFEGRFSGDVELPKFTARLTVPNASFNSAGNFELAAYGQASFPGAPTPEANRVSFSIPKRRPLSISVTDQGSFSISGASKLTLPGGHTVSGFLSIDDPHYRFELAYGGKLRLDLLEQITLVRPTLDLDPENPLDLQTSSALASFLGILGAGYEGFVEESPDFPSAAEIDPGAAPDFQNPVLTLPTDALDAWIVSLANEEVVSRVNGNYGEAVEALRGFLQSASEEFTAARDELGFELEQLQRLNKRAQQLAKAKEALDKAGEQQVMEDADISALLAEAEAAAQEALEASEAYLVNLPADSPLAVNFAAIDLHLQALSSAAALGLDPEINYTLIAERLANGADELLQEAGLNRDGSIADSQQLASLSDRRLLVLATVFQRLFADEQAAALDSVAIEEPVAYFTASKRLYEALRDRKRTAYDTAVISGDLENRVLNAVWRMEFNTLVALGYIDSSDGTLLDYDAFQDSYQAIRDRRGLSGGTPTDEKLALDFVEAARDYISVEFDIVEKEVSKELGRTRKTRFDFDFRREDQLGSQSLWDLIATNWKVLEQRGLLDPAQLQKLKGSLAQALRGYVLSIAQGEEISAEAVERNFNAVHDSLNFAVDTIAWIEEHLPDDTQLLDLWLASWEPLSLEFYGVAEARNAWWYLSEYTENIALASTRYGLGVSDATEAAFSTAGTQSLDALGRVVDVMSTAFQAVNFETFDFALPGDLTIERLYGELAFNRLTGDWALAFGGAARFPEINLFFSLDRASLASNGAFELRLRTSGPVPFGFDDTLDLNVANAFALTGNLLTPSITNASASGSLIQQLQGGGTQTYSINIAYSYAHPNQHSFAFNSQATGDFEVFTEDLMIFSGGIGFELTIDQFGAPSQGEITASSTVGMLAKSKPLPDDPSPNDFQLVFDGQASVATSAEETSVTLGPGSLKLPEAFEARTCGLPGVPAPGANRPSVSVPAAAPLVFTYTPGETNDPLQGAVAFSGSLLFEGLRFSLPGLEGLWVDVCSLNLEFGYDSVSNLPTARLKELEGVVNVPLPNEKNVQAGLEVQDWSLDRLPDSAEIYLAEDLPLFEQGGFALTALGGRDGLDIPRTAIGLFTDDDTGLPGFFLAATFNARAEDWFQNRNGEDVPLEGALGGNLVVLPPPNLQELTLDDFAIDIPLFQLGAEGELLFGGSAGIAVVDPSLTLVNPLRALNPTPQTPFKIGLDMGIRIVTGAAYDFTVQGESMELIFDGTDDAPLVALGPLGGCLETADINGGEPTSLAEDLPFYVNRFCINFKNLTQDQPVPLFPDSPDELPAFSSENIEIILSAGLALPPSEPIVSGQVNDLTVSFVNNVPTLSLDGIGLGVNLAEYLGDEFPFGGTVFIGGFQTGNYYFSGKLQANIKGNLVEAIGAFDTKGLRGICFGLAGSELAIPIAYGFVLTGARGGIAVGNGAIDPCDFVALMNIDPATGQPSPTGPGEIGDPEDPFANCPLVSWDQLQQIKDNNLDREAIALDMAKTETAMRLVAEAGLNGEEAAAVVDEASAEDLAQLNADLESDSPDTFCPTPGTCPPASLGILAQPHPEAFIEGSPYQHRAILKFSSIDESTLNLWGIDRDLVDSLVPALEFNRDQIAARIGEDLRLRIESLIPAPPEDLPQPLPDWAATFEAELSAILQEIELGFFNAIGCGLDVLGAPVDRDDLVDQIYQLVVNSAYAGVPYADFTYRLEGSFSYTGVSSFASITAGMMSSTSGTWGLNGTINVFGIPVGYIRAFVGQFDAFGNPSPSFCGEADIAIGPLELGSGGLVFDCPGCVTRIFESFADLSSALTGSYVYQTMLLIDPDLADPELSAAEHFALLDTEELQLAFLAAMLHSPPAPVGGQPTAAFQQFMVDLADALAPRLAACAAVQPKLFGFSLSGENVTQGVQLYMGPKDLQDISQGFRLYSEYNFSPLQVMTQTLFSVSGASAVLTTFLPAIDQATTTSLFEADSLGTLLNESFVLTPVQFAEKRVADFLDTSINTYEYSLSPLGLELARAGGRIVFPSFEHHPKGKNPRVPPEERRDFQLPSEREVLFAALGDSKTDNLLADPFWRGEPKDIAALFAGTDYEKGTSQAPLDLVDDYFPHGGFLGAAELSMPKLLTEGLPPSYFVMIGATQASIIERVQALQEFLAYIGETDVAGDVSFYLPAPNPPSLLASGFPASPKALVEDLRNYNPLTDFTELYPLNEAFFRGQLDVQLLGLPVTRADLLLVPEEQLYRATAETPPDAWFAKMLGSSSFVAQMRQGVDADKPAAETIEEWRVQAAKTLGSNNEREMLILINQVIADLNRRLPRLNINYNADGMKIPFPGYDLTKPGGITVAALGLQDVAFAAYTPQFDPEHEGDSLFDQIRREGGMGFRGGFDFEQGGLTLANAQAAGIISSDTSFLGMPSLAAEFTAEAFSIDGVDTSPLGQVQGSIAASSLDFSISLEADLPALPLLFFNLQPLSGKQSFPVSASLAAQALDFGSARFEIGPAQFTMPFFAADTMAIMHGDSVSDPFSFDSGDEWAASATITDPALELKVGEILVARITGSTTDTFLASLAGNGLQAERLEVANLPNGLLIETYPNLPDGDLRKHSVAIGSGGSGDLLFEADGDFELNLDVSTPTTVAELNGASLQPGYSLRLTENSFSLNAKVPSLSIPGFIALQPLPDDSDDLLALTAFGTTSGALAIEMEPARLDFSLAGVQTVATLDGGTDGKGEPAPISFSTTGSWSARILMQELTFDPDGTNTVVPQFARITPFSDGRGGGGALFSALLNGNGLNSLSLAATREDLVNLELLPGTPFAKTYPKLGIGSQSFAIDSSGDFELELQNFFPGSFNLGSIPSGSTTVPLLSVSGNSSSDLLIDNDGLQLSLTAPSVSIASESIGSSGLGAFTATFDTDGDFSASFATSSNKNLFGPLLQLRAGTHTLSGDASNLANTLSLNALGRIEIVVPTLNGGTVGSSLAAHNFTLDLDAGQTFSHTWDPSSITGFDLGWAELQAGGDGRVHVERTDSDFSVAVENWDLYLFGVKFNNQADLSFSSSGGGSVTLGSATFDFGASEDYWMQLVTNAGLPFTWNATTGAITLKIPTQADLKFPGAGLLSGTFVDGLDIPSNFPTLTTDGTFDHSFDRTVVLNGVDFGSVEVRFYRSFANGNVRFLIDHSLGNDFAGLDLDVYLSTGNSFRMRLEGNLEVPINGFFGTWATLDGSDADGNLELASVDLDLSNNALTQFQGSATILGLSYTVRLGSVQSYIAPQNFGWLQFPLPLLPKP